MSQTKGSSKIISCGRCGNISRMEIIGDVFHNTSSSEDYEHGPAPEEGTTYSVMLCPACNKVNITSYYWHDFMDGEDDVTYKLIFPQNDNAPLGLPDEIKKAYEAAEKVKTIDANAYAILTRRMLEIVCINSGANGKTLAVMLQDLATKNEIPQKLVKVAEGLKNFGNVGAHAGSGDLSNNEIPILQSLSTAILQYVYSAPHLATIAENRLKAVKSKP